MPARDIRPDLSPSSATFPPTHFSFIDFRHQAFSTTVSSNLPFCSLALAISNDVATTAAETHSSAIHRDLRMARQQSIFQERPRDHHLHK
jgi:hypothetical protein